MRKTIGLVIAVFVFLLVSCSTINKTAIQYQQQNVNFPSPTMQTFIYNTVSEAINSIWNTGDNININGKKVDVEINGILPMQYNELPSYIKSKIESELASKGAIISNTSTEKSIDYHVVINLNNSGVDISGVSKSSIKNVLGPLALISSGTIMTVVGVSTRAPELVYLVAGSGITSGIAWILLSPRKADYILRSSINMEIYFLPQNQESKYFVLFGKAEKSMIVSDENNNPIKLVTKNISF